MTLGDRIAQFILEKIHIPVLIEHKEKLEDTVRGEGGFGSTGVKVWALLSFITYNLFFRLENRGGTTMRQITQKLKLKLFTLFALLSLPVNTV